MVDGGSAATEVVVDLVAEARGVAVARGAVVAGEVRVGAGVGLGRTERLTDAAGEGAPVLEAPVAVLAATAAADRVGPEAVVLAGALQPVSTTPASRAATATRRLLAVLVTLAPVVRLPLGGTSRPHPPAAAGRQPAGALGRALGDAGDGCPPSAVSAVVAISVEKSRSVERSLTARRPTWMIDLVLEGAW